MSDFQAIALLVAFLVSAAFWIVTIYRLAAQIDRIGDRMESDLRENFPAANPPTPAESIQEAVRIHDQTR